MSNSQRSLIKKSNNLITVIDGELTVGRSATCGLQLTEGSPSRLHARLTVEGDQVWVEDQGSTNGTFINGVRIAERMALHHSDNLRFDIEEYTYSAGVVDSDKTMLRQPAPAAPAPSRSPPSVPPPPPTPPPPPAPAPATAAAAPVAAPAPKPAQQLPPGWIEGGGQGAGANKTVFKSPQELAEERRLAGAAQPAPSAAAQFTDVPVLLINSGQAAGSRVELRAHSSDRQEWNIGSDAAREVRLNDSGVSALHARIIKDGERWKLVDQVSANGTYVNGKRATMSYLSSGDRIAFGPVECTFMLPGSRPAAPRGAAAPAAADAPSARKWSTGRIVLIGVVSFVATLVVIYLLFR